ncbi:hypothetical protein C8J57DRAFT_755369 [Mycena rebaudengoi]|nr:hypothetical protein C8J57DRAFT_755369 [Mycena rebaudengoi]
MNQIIIRHNNTRIFYSAGWSPTHGPDGTEHTTSTTGATFGLAFRVSEGASVEVFGGLRRTSSDPDLLVQSQYQIDDGPPFVYDAPRVEASTILQLFNRTGMSAGPHRLLVRVTSTGSDMPYYLDYIRVNGSLGDDRSTDPADKPQTVHKSPPIGAIVGTALGGVLFLLILSGVLFFLLRRRRWRRPQDDILSSVINVDREGVSPFIDRRSTLPMRSKLALGENSTSATVDGSGAIRLGTGQIILPQDIPPAY